MILQLSVLLLAPWIAGAADLIPKKIVCYFSSTSFYKGNFSPEQIDSTLCTHINYDFAVLNGSTFEIDYGDVDLDVGSGFFERVTSLKNNNDRLKVLLSMGGWVDSTKKYSQLVADPAKRQNFISTVIPFLKQHSFDGLDVAWEYPNCWQGNCGCNSDDKLNFIEFLQELRQAFDLELLLLTASVSAAKDEIDAAYYVPKLSELLDHINVMSFDLHGGWEHETGHHAQFYRLPYDKAPTLNADASMKYWSLQGAERRKLIMGIPSYGRSFTLASPGNKGLYAPVAGLGHPGPITLEGGYYAFHEMCHDIQKGGWTEKEDHCAGSYATKDDQWIGYDSPKLAVQKARYVFNNGFGGVAYKNFHSDDHSGTCYGQTFPILRSLKYGLYVYPEKDFETQETNMRAFMEKMQLTLLVRANQGVVDSAEAGYDNVEDDDVVLHLKETRIDDWGKAQTTEIDINAGTLQTNFTNHGKTFQAFG